MKRRCSYIQQHSHRIPGRIGSHPRIRNPPRHLHLRQPGNKNGDPPGRYRPARCGNPNSTLADWSCSQRAARVAPRDNVQVPPHRGMIGSLRRIRNPSMISLQPTTQQPGDENSDPPGRYRPARCGNPKPTGWLLSGRGSWSQRTARIAPRANVEVPPHPGRIRSHPQIRKPSTTCTLQQRGDENRDLSSRYRPARCVNPNSHWLICLLYTSPSPRDGLLSRMPSSA